MRRTTVWFFEVAILTHTHTHTNTLTHIHTHTHTLIHIHTHTHLYYNQAMECPCWMNACVSLLQLISTTREYTQLLLKIGDFALENRQPRLRDSVRDLLLLVPSGEGRGGEWRRRGGKGSRGEEEERGGEEKRRRGEWRGRGE